MFERYYSNQIALLNLNSSLSGYPDPNGMVVLSSSPFTAPANGIIVFSAKSGTTFDEVEWVYGSINGISYALAGARAVNSTQWYPIKQGQELIFKKGSNSTVKFYPLLK